MKRRSFLSILSGQILGFGLAGTAHAMGEMTSGEHYGTTIANTSSISSIGSYSLSDIRSVFFHEVHEITIPLWKKQGVDWKFGGYLPHLDESGTPTTTNKQLYYQGRVLWLYSYFYNHFDRDDYHLRAAENGFRFLSTFCHDENYDWYTEVKRDGTPVMKSYDIYAHIYMVLGLGEYYHASGNNKALELACATCDRINEIILSSTYQAQGHGPWYEPGTKRLGTWLHYLNALTPLLRYTDNRAIEKTAKMCVRNILNRHWRPEEGIAYEILQPDMTPHTDDLFIDNAERGFQNQSRWVNNFHTMEAAWMVMEEALRVGNREMFTEGMRLGRSHLDKYWVKRGDEQGIIQFLRPDDPDPLSGRNICKPYVFKEIFILLLLAAEHSDKQWAIDWFDRAFSYAYEKPLVWPWMDTLHQPRGAMFCLEILDRMIARNGKRSDFFDTV